MLELLPSQGNRAGKAWATHISGQLCHALRHHLDRFAEPSIAAIQAYIGDLKFGANTQLDDYQLDPELDRALKRINQIIDDSQFESVETSLLAARNAQQSSIKEGQPVSKHDAPIGRQGPRYAVAISPDTLPLPKKQLRDVVIHTNTGIFGNDVALEKFPPVSKPVRLSDQIWIGPIEADIAKAVMDSCETKGLGIIAPIRQFAQLYSFIRELPANSDIYEWDSDNQLTTSIALSRLIHPTSVGLAYAARIAYGPNGLTMVHPAQIRGIGINAFMSSSRTRDWITEHEAERLGKLLSPYPSSLPQRILNALWYHEYAARTYYLDHRWTFVCTALEALIHTDRGGSTMQFKKRVSKLASELGVTLSENEADRAYDLRSGLAHGTSFLSTSTSRGATSDQIDWYDRLEDTLRLAILRAMQDRRFADVFMDDDQIRVKWVI
jgi:hypothetical protein